MPHTPASVPDFAKWPSFPFEGNLRVKQLDDPVDVEPPRKGEGTAECASCNAPDHAYIWVSERWRVRAMDRPTGLPMVLILESRSHFDLGDLPNLLAAELGVMTVRLERAIRSLDGVARVHVNRWGDGSSHLHMWFLARPYGQLQLRGTFLSLWDSILPPIPESQWRERLALIAAWLAEFGGRPLAEPPRIQWRTPSNLTEQASSSNLFANDADDENPIEELIEPLATNSAEPELGAAETARPAGTATRPGGLDVDSADDPDDAGNPQDGIVATDPDHTEHGPDEPAGRDTTDDRPVRTSGDPASGDGDPAVDGGGGDTSNGATDPAPGHLAG